MKRFLINLMAVAVLLAFVAPQALARDVTLNFKDADIRAFIEFVAGFSGRNFLIDNRVKGKVTIISPSPVSDDAAYAIFLSVLEVNGFAAVESGSVIKIVPRAEGKQKPLPVVSGVQGDSGTKKSAGDELVTEVIRLKYADASQLMGILRPLVPPNSNLSVYPRGNILLMTDSAANIRRIRQVVQLLDRNEALGVKVFSLKHASAEKVAKTLGQLYGGGPTQGAAGRVKAMAYQPGNMLIVVAAPQLLNEVLRMVGKLDIAPQMDSGRLYVRYLKNADAEDVAKVINNLIGGQSQGAKGAISGKSLFISDVKVVADPATNALLITADASDRIGLDRLIDKLDIRRLQVLIEALIIEISSNGAQQFGMEFRGLSDPTTPGRKAIGGTNFSVQGGTSINSLAAATTPLNPGNGLAVGIVDGTVSFGGSTFLNLGALLRALETKSDANVLSTPNILTMDNEEAEIIVGQNVPFVTGSSSTQGGTANPFQTIQRQDVGLTLRVTPQISEGDTIRLKIFQEVSSVAASQGTAQDIVTNKRSIKTTVLASDGNIIVLGGLMRDDSTKGVQRVPCIGAIPIIGEPFKFTDNSRSKTNLMVFLRPHIIRSRQDMKKITQQKYREVQGVYDKQSYEGTILFPQDKTPLPKDMNPLAEPDVTSPDSASPNPTLPDTPPPGTP
ncbi:MAG: type II secretion system secretin GspD [Mariprofundaceae bacterium]|nr:type II secretion system secretin GspD [Mariprofundaceae bacterium]